MWSGSHVNTILIMVQLFMPSRTNGGGLCVPCKPEMPLQMRYYIIIDFFFHVGTIRLIEESEITHMSPFVSYYNFRILLTDVLNVFV